MAYYNRLEKGHTDRCYTFLLNCVRKYLERQRQDRAKAERVKSVGKTVLAAVGEKKGVCYAYKRGTCQKGNDCPYKHVREHSTETQGKGKGRDGKGKGRGRGRSTSPGGRPRICSFYLRGECRKTKEQCEFDHPPPCRFYPKGTCTRGNGCPIRAPTQRFPRQPRKLSRAEGDLRQRCRKCD